jgi:hypothetical protein
MIVFEASPFFMDGCGRNRDVILGSSGVYEKGLGLM